MTKTDIATRLTTLRTLYPTADATQRGELIAEAEALKALLACYCDCGDYIPLDHPGFPFAGDACKARYWAAHPPKRPLTEQGRPRPTIEECITRAKEIAIQVGQEPLLKDYPKLTFRDSG